MKPHELEAFLKTQIPQTSSLGVQVVRADPQGVELWAPLTLNHNHLNTAFGGSLNSIMLLACYTWLFDRLNLQNQDQHIVLKQSQAQYFFPVDEDIKAYCLEPDPESFQKFEKIFQRKGRARILLSAYVQISRGKACELQGEFVTVAGVSG